MKMVERKLSLRVTRNPGFVLFNFILPLPGTEARIISFRKVPHIFEECEKASRSLKEVMFIKRGKKSAILSL